VPDLKKLPKLYFLSESFVLHKRICRVGDINLVITAEFTKSRIFSFAAQVDALPLASCLPLRTWELQHGYQATYKQRLVAYERFHEAPFLPVDCFSRVCVVLFHRGYWSVSPLASSNTHEVSFKVAKDLLSTRT
jgi:hypothetical protein